ISALFVPMLAATAHGQMPAEKLDLSAWSAATATAAPAPAEARTALTGHVVVISVDGLRPDAIEKFGAKNIQRLIREGSYSLEATTILPSKTLPSHTSMLTGTEPAA